MIYTKDPLKEFLEGELSIGYDPVRIAQKAFLINTEPSYEIPEEIKEILYLLEIMEMGEEFYLSEEQIREMIDILDNKMPPDAHQNTSPAKSVFCCKRS
ncbi:MAG: hypothetical protein LBH00_08065 [Planctomycetaceae bacterium]|jgi:hypothetical protein|nr:hypothetical protein [Planctomycetaceae bacterium]